MDIIDYLNTKNQTNITSIDDFNEVDAAVLSLASYFPFEIYASKDSIYPVEELFSKQIFNYEVYANFFKSITKSKRFKKIKITNFTRIIDYQKELQYASCVFELTDDLAFLAIRGTEDTVLGWKENLNMSIVNYLPSDYCGKEAIDEYLDNHPNQTLIVGGHSKGGNIAVIASALSLNKDRISRIYDLDGPGYNQVFIKSEGYKRIKERIKSIIPVQSIVGILMEKRHPVKIISSNKRGVSQHFIINWKIQDNHFIESKIIHKETHNFVNMFVKKTTPELRENFLETVYPIILSGNDDILLKDMTKPKKIINIYQSYLKLPSSDKKIVKDVFKILLKCIRSKH